ncbi:acyl transferase [Catalinimonas niigatensis]|uniref:acyl transferase n=1 Tax=Catalinimonas niigatensis TaxID=1397264 RepID=UPI0026665F3F|nr:acyl transferase [Catalinimonas niigatensis]WPP49924.1 acyl transferase [Catalinimonas niigatensis]
MQDAQFFKDNLFNINAQNFEEHALSLFRWQAIHNPVYQQYISFLGVKIDEINQISQIPFLPIAFFKNHRVITLDTEASVFNDGYFESSGTTGQQRSRHYISDFTFYLKVCQYIFELQYAELSNFHIFALLPSYLDRKHASLVAMAEHFIQQSQSSFSGFYLQDYEKLIEQLRQAQQSNRKVLLLGVTFALLDLAEKFRPNLKDVIVMETGGMKGRRKEIIRQELHQILKTELQVDHIHAEYGMTELLSQAYAQQDGLFLAPPWMRILIRDVNDPFHFDPKLRYGGINVIDLANVHSCAFIETQDLGKLHNSTNTFEVLGRFDNTDTRGCNLMVSF